MVNSKEQSVTISPSQITSDYIPTREEMATPTPEPSERAGSEASESSGSKKRKSWGQPIPEYQAILPPGKRAKTEEEKEQRRCERIVRNRKAAATSRDRKKMEFERLEQENKILREQLAQQQAIIQAMQNGQPLPTFSQQAPVQFTANAPPTPASLAVEPHTGTSTPRASSPTISVISLSNRAPQKSSPTLTASLFIKNETPEMNSTFAHDSPSFDGLSDLGSLDSFNPSPALDDMITHTISNPQSALESFANIENSAGVDDIVIKTEQQVDQQRTHHSVDGSERHVQYLLKDNALNHVTNFDFLGADLATSTVGQEDSGHDFAFDAFIDYPTYDGNAITSSLPDGLSAQTSCL
ncbi:putative transcriptional activator hac1 [Phaeomoniella chlamydospora]|uniref:Putative transcriptional activator hac1 n=1 Tax=Phaeomoniella chlamydospora TaxID=158046 RepID=A0A0G2GSN3_PHACM|nr:putative transcriptional activator hac1 [Phaeomoniella chlamydospora]